MTNLTLSDLTRAVRRRPWWIAAAVAAGLVLAWVALHFMTPVYRASTLVMVERQKVPDDYVKPTVTTSMEERLRTIEQQITNRSNLERIIQEMDLYAEARRELPMEKVVERARDNLTVGKKGDSVFTIHFKNPDPVKAANTANRIAELFIQENLKLRENQAEGTSTFLEAELRETKERLEQQEAKIAAFKQMYMGQLPEQRDSNFQAIGQLQDKLEINMDAVDKAELRKIYLQRQISELSQAPPLSLPSSPSAPSRLEQLQAQLIELRARFTDKHPDVIRTRAEIEQLKKMQSEELEVADASPLPSSRVDPALRAQLDAVDLEIRSLHSERARILDDLAMYQARVESIPQVEQGLLSLTRDYDNIQRSYESLLAKRIDAGLAENLERSRQSEQFTILEKAIPPVDPYQPNRLLVMAIGLAGGLLLGMAAVFMRDQTETTFADAEGLQKQFPGVQVLATIPVLSGTGESRAQVYGYGRLRRST